MCDDADAATLAGMPSSPPIRVVLADQARATRRVLAGLLQGLPEVELVGQAADADELNRLMRDRRPHVVIVDDRLFAERPIAVRDAAVRVIVIGIDDAPAYAARALKSGAHAWVPKEQADALLPELLLSAA